MPHTRGPRPPAVVLTVPEKQALETLVSRHRTPQQLALRARMILLAAQGENNAGIARQLGADTDIVRKWRGRWLALSGVPLEEMSVEERLADEARSGRPATFSAEQVVALLALCCEQPEGSQRPISHWSGREIAQEAVKRGIVERISARHVRRLLKRGTSSLTSFATG